MKEFKNRTIALILASVVTVAGAFGSENYKNSLMSLDCEGTTSGAVNLTLRTKTTYTNNINPIKKDAYTYVIMLPETNSNAEIPELSGNIESIDIKTMPYTNSGKGYTKITIKTTPNTVLNAKKALYIPQKAKSPEADTQNPETVESLPAPPPSVQTTKKREARYTTPSTERLPEPSKYAEKQNISQNEDTIQADQNSTSEDLTATTQKADTDNKSGVSGNNDFTDYFLLICGFLAVVLFIVYLYQKSKRKMAEMLGDQTDLDFNDDDTKKTKKETKRKTIKKTIAALDKMYSKPMKMPINSFDNINSQADDKSVTDDNIVDLDELFQQQTQDDSEQVQVDSEQDSDENDALEAFLSDFSFDEEALDDASEKMLEETNIRKELFEKFINNQKIRFSKDDLQKMESLMNLEISNDAISELKDREPAATNPIKPSKKQLLEDFMTSYAIKQNITFSRDDVEALRRLISVELDNDFITDLRTNPERASSMRKELEERNVSASKKVNEILTLNVKDMLPDLSEALRKQGNKKIESNAKPEVVYFSEGYEYTKLSAKDNLPDLSIEINRESTDSYRPSDEIELSVSGYETQTLHVDSMLPDLDDVKAHPKKYEDAPKKQPKASEKELLKNLSNVTFKSFYDGNEDFEILNKPEDFEDINTDSVREEFNQFSNFEVVNDDNNTEISLDSNYDDFEELYSNDYYDLDKDNDIELNLEAKEAENDISTEFIQETAEESEDLSEKIADENEIIERPAEEPIKMTSPNVCIIDGEKFEIINTQHFTENIGCYLAKNSQGYSILGFTGDSIFKIKHYQKLGSEKLQSRISEKLPDGSARYIVRIGIHKFILNVSKENMEYLMDLC